MGIAGAQLIKARKPVIGKRGEKGRFVTLKTGRVIFLPEGRQSKWADVKEKVMTSKKVPWGEGKVVKQTRLTSGTNPNYLVEFEDGSRAIHKINQVTGTAEAEALAYEFSKSIGWDIVPETMMPEGTKDVTRQRWVEGETAFEVEEAYYETGEGGGFLRKDPKMLAMDALLGNHDRHLGNILIDKNGKQWAVDNGQAFGAHWGEEGRKHYNYGSTKGWTKGKGVAPGAVGSIDAAKDIAKWFKTPEYTAYVEQVEETLGPGVARQFSLNVADMVDWSRKAKVVGRPLTVMETVGLKRGETA